MSSNRFHFVLAIVFLTAILFAAVGATLAQDNGFSGWSDFDWSKPDASDNSDSPLPQNGFTGNRSPEGTGEDTTADTDIIDGGSGNDTIWGNDSDDDIFE